MKNKNLYTMKQPELGKRILELRKSKGFTQEELVDKCNINVRTIQRIEAGEVSPRNFTIKTILEVLGVDADAFFEPSVHENVTFSKEDRNTLQYSWISAILFTIFGAVGLVVESYLLSYDEPVDGEIIYRGISGVLMLTTLLFYLRGYKVLGDRYGHKMLVSASYVYFVLEFLMILFTIILTVFEFDSAIIEGISGVALIMMLGIGELILGIGIQKLKEQMGSFAQVVGVIKLVNGALFISVILSPIAVFLALPVLVLEIVLLYRASQLAKG